MTESILDLLPDENGIIRGAERIQPESGKLKQGKIISTKAE